MVQPKIQLYLSVFVFFWALFALTNNGIDLSEGRYHYLVAEQIIKYGRLDFDSVPPDSVFSLAPNGKYYASHESGNTLFLLPTTAVNLLIEKILSPFTKGIPRIKDFIVSFQAGFYSASATTFFGTLKTRFFLTITSSFLAICLVLTTFFWTYSRNLFDRQEAIYVVAIFIFWLLLHGRMRSWYGAWGWGPRYFITILPILFLPFASNIDDVIKKIFLRINAVILGSFGFFLAISSIISNWFIRIDYAIQNKTFGDRDFVWGFWNSQAVDMLKAGLENLTRIITNSPVPEKAKIYPGQIEYVSNTLNVWLNSIGTKLPIMIRVLPLVFLCFLIYVSLRNILRSEYVKSG